MRGFVRRGIGLGVLLGAALGLGACGDTDVGSLWGGANRAPTVAAIANQTVAEGQTLSIPVSAADPDGDALTLSAPNLPIFCNLTDNGNGTGVIACAPSFDHAGSYVGLQVVASDGVTQGSTTFTLTVEERQPPVANAGPDQTASEEDTVTLDGTLSTDADGTIVSFAWVQTLGPAVALTGEDTAQPSFAAPGVGVAGELLEFQLTVTDDHGLEATDTVQVRVDDVTGIVWNPRVSPLAQPLHRVAWSGSRFVALSALAGAVATSPDGRTWVSTATEVDVSLQDVVWAPELGLWVAVGLPAGGNAPVLTSLDGLDWTLRESNVAAALGAVTWSGSDFVAVGHGRAVRSVDGITWTAADTGIAARLSGVAWTGARYVAVGGEDAPVIATSPDGAAWTDVTPAGLGAPLWGVAWSGTTLVAVGTGGEIWISTDADGADWVQVIPGLSQTLHAVTWTSTAGRFLAVGDQGVLAASSDGQDWTTFEAGTTEPLIDVLETDTRIVVVGGSSAPATSVILTSP